MIDFLLQALEGYWPQIFGVIGTVGPIMSVMVPKLLNDKKIIKGQATVMDAVNKFQEIRETVLDSVSNLEKIAEKLQENVSIPANISGSVEILVKNANAKIAEFDKKVLELTEFKKEVVKVVENEINKNSKDS